MDEHQEVQNEAALKELSHKVARAQESRKEAEPQVQANSKGMALGMRMASEFVSAILVGGLFGFGFDYWLKSTPFGMLAGLGLGFAAGVMNLIRASKEYSASVPVGSDLPPENKVE
ncbi:MAG: ATP synthase protein I [Hyphomonadaceae bacterium]|nr:MAG: ATP synthase protein I [Hyphomonadaceae bacterium]KAF0185499.1 MAG: ATP synthase protein I [Hyphomonadaceae bacterium]